MPKPLAGGYELLITQQGHSGLGEDHRVLTGWSTLYCKDKVKKIKNWLNNQSLLSIDQKKELEMTPALEKEILVVSTSSKNFQRQAQRTSEEAERLQGQSGKGKSKRKLAQPLTTRVQYPQIGTFSHGQCFQYGQNSYGIHSQRRGKDEQEFSTQIIHEIQFVKASIDFKLGQFNSKLNKITSDINDLKKNDRTSSEWHKLKTTRHVSISNTCDRIGSIYQVKDDGMEDIFIANINYQLIILKNNILEIVNNTNLFATHLAESDSEWKKLKDEIISHVEKLHKNYEPNLHIPRNFTPLNKEKISVKGSLTPFVGENAIFARDITKLEEWSTCSGGGEYNHI
ncbi:hypothetical protein O181_068265 [Austropuccinia psidii MF-1]|uniref:Uncharacterized protein n=1 Tax=Austropuccinia psidii MF-1 TaxID=1389203 RepID=A0A9Q3I6X0_9BASI|nr:hypothetical protein [Austropuccinia psidii MF-1]